ncbi:MAG: nucleotide sugar dehydrogenase [Syntrophothermus sp.]
MKRVCVVGLGYIGLPTACMAAVHGYRVIGVDIDQGIVDAVNEGMAGFLEPGLSGLVASSVREGRLVAQSIPEPADIFVVAVPTPLAAGKKADLSYVEAAAGSLVPYLRKGNLVILESTVPPGTTDGLFRLILEKSGLSAGRDFFIAHCPERVLPGDILHELRHNDRVIGGVTPQAANLAKELYASFVEGELYLTDARTAEMVKLMENTYRDVNVALANEFARVAEEIGINIWEAVDLANRHPRVNIHKPGPGVGGHCLAIDPWFITEAAPAATELIAAARRINDGMPAIVAEKVLGELWDAGVRKPRIALWGVAYKGNVDDVRESPAWAVIKYLQEGGASVSLYDPYVHLPDADPHLAGTSGLTGLRKSVRGTDCILIITDHHQFKEITPERVGLLMRNRILVDTRNCVDHEVWRKAGFVVKVLGNAQEMRHGRSQARARAL